MAISLISNWNLYSFNLSFQSSYTARYTKIYDVTYNLLHIYRYIIYKLFVSPIIITYNALFIARISLHIFIW